MDDVHTLHHHHIPAIFPLFNAHTLPCTYVAAISFFEYNVLLFFFLNNILQTGLLFLTSKLLMSEIGNENTHGILTKNLIRNVLRLM